MFLLADRRNAAVHTTAIALLAELVESLTSAGNLLVLNNCTQITVTSQTVSPKNAKATAFQFARTSFPCKSGIGGSTGLRFEVPATCKADQLRYLTQSWQQDSRRTTNRGRWTKSNRYGAATTTTLRPTGLWCSHDECHDGCHEGCHDGKYTRADCVVEQCIRRTEHVNGLCSP